MTDISNYNRDELREYLYTKHTQNTDKENAAHIFDLAWEYGHSSGNSEVEYYYIDLVELINKICGF